MHNNRYYIYSLVLALCCFSLIGCFSYECPDAEQAETIQNDAIYITLQINSGQIGSRTSPIGGEDGDGKEDGINNEARIEKLIMLFIEANEGDIDPNKFIDDTSKSAKASKVIIESCELIPIINQSSAKSWTTLPMEVKNITLNKEYYLIVVANVYQSQLSDIKTLGDIQDFIFSDNHWNNDVNISKYNRFVMTSCFKNNDDIKKVMVTRANNQSNPAQFSTTLERLAARVDIIPSSLTNDAIWDNGYFEFPVKPADGATSKDTVRLVGIQLINKNNQGSYLLKHFAEADSEQKIDYNNIKRIGTEAPTSGIQTNYVVEPNTEQKTGTQFPTWYDNFYDSVVNWYDVPQTIVGKHYILDYTRENTISMEYQNEYHYITSLNIKCVYIPAGFTPGETFYTYDNKSYKTLESLVETINMIDGANTVTSETVLKHPDVTTYKDGLCYYRYQIKHSNDNNDLVNGIMEFGIVRNNIYRITINKFKGIGYNHPNIPLDIMSDIDFHIWVVPWHIIDNPEIIL